MKNITIIIFIIIINFITSTVLAADSSPSADIRAKLEELKKEIASKAAKIKLEVDRKLTDKVFIGKVKKVSETSLNLDTRNGIKNVNMNQDSLFGSDTKLKYAKKLIKEEDYVAALGDVDDTGALTAKKIILLPTPNSQLKTHFWGQIVSVSEKLATLKDRNLKNVAVSLPNQSSIKPLDFVILTGRQGKNDIFESEFVYIIPQAGILKPKQASHSASPSVLPHIF